MIAIYSYGGTPPPPPRIRGFRLVVWCGANKIHTNKDFYNIQILDTNLSIFTYCDLQLIERKCEDFYILVTHHFKCTA